MKNRILIALTVFFSYSLFAQNVGIGTAGPSEKLDVVGNIKSSGEAYWGNSGTRTTTRNDAGMMGVGARSGFYETSSPVNFPSGASSWWHLIDTRHSNSSNNYGMQIAGSFFDQELWYRKTDNSATTSWSKIISSNEVSGTGNYVPKFTGTNSIGNSQVYDNGTNVGIGTTSPGYKFDVSGTGRFTGQLIIPVTPTANAHAASKQYVDNLVGSVTETDPTWSGSANTSATVGRTGNVGIGTTSPSGKLHVSGGDLVIQEGGFLTTSGDDIRVLGGTTSDDSSYEWFGFYSGNTRQGIILYDGAWTGANNLTNEFSITAENSNKLTLNTSGGDIALMPDGSGNVGVGTTSPSYKFQTQGDIYANGGWMRVSGNQGLYFESHGGGWYMSDGTWIRTYGNKNIYHNTGVMRTDGTFQVGGSGGTLNVANGGNFSYRTNVLFANTSGNVGVGTSGPSQKLDVNGNIRADGSFYMRSTSPTVYFRDTDHPSYMIHANSDRLYVLHGATNGTSWNGNRPLTIYQGNKVGINNATPSYELHVNGRIRTTGINEVSDIRFKKDINPLENSLDKIEQLRGVSYYWRQDEFPNEKFKNGVDLGLIAQEVEKILPEVVLTDNDGYKSVQYSHIVPVLIEAVKELSSELKMKNELLSEIQNAQSNQACELEKTEVKYNAQLEELSQKVAAYELVLKDMEQLDMNALKAAFSKEKYTASK